MPPSRKPYPQTAPSFGVRICIVLACEPFQVRISSNVTTLAPEFSSTWILAAVPTNTAVAAAMASFGGGGGAQLHASADRAAAIATAHNNTKAEIRIDF